MKIYDMTQEENILWAKRNLVDTIWKSANLEGIAVTFPETQTIIEGMSIANHSLEDIDKIVYLKKAWQEIFETINEPLTLDYIKHIHSIMGHMTVINAGSLRRDEVFIAGTEYVPEIPNEAEVKEEINNIINAQEDDLDKALNILCYLTKKQLFYDGNKRISMLITNKELIRTGNGVLAVPIKHIEEYIKKLVSFYEIGNSAPLKEFVVEKCISGIHAPEPQKRYKCR